MNLSHKESLQWTSTNSHNVFFPIVLGKGKEPSSLYAEEGGPLGFSHTQHDLLII